jgi:uncharacterized membrane protein
MSTTRNARLEAFCDGVFAIAATLLVIEIRSPSPAEIESTSDLWSALLHLIPALLAFVLSFVVILITWVNHHAVLKLIDKSSTSFVYANGFLLFTVAIVPFPTSLLGEYVVTDHAAPAVALYAAVLALQGAAWVLVCSTVSAGGLAKHHGAEATIRANGRYGYGAFALYSVLAALALLFAKVVAAIIAATWIFWLVLGIRMKGNEGPVSRVCGGAWFDAPAPLSRRWIGRFQFGPAEWIWRCLTYGRAQPLRLASAPRVATPVVATVG